MAKPGLTVPLSAGELRAVNERPAQPGVWWFDRGELMDRRRAVPPGRPDHARQTATLEEGQNMGAFNPMRDEDWYDVMQVCKNGHIITTFARSHPQNQKKRCQDCGAATIMACPKCNVAIQGYHHVPGVVSLGSQDLPAHCHECGEPYPWTQLGALGQAQAMEGKRQMTATTSVFIVHGHDDVMKQYVARTVEKLGLKPIILHEQPNAGKTIIEKFEKNADVGFAVVLLSPDDKAYPAGGDAKQAKSRARQNVVLELGYFVGRLGRDHVFTLKRGDDLELPSDFSGVVYTAYDQAGHWRLELVRELKAAGYTVDANNLL